MLENALPRGVGERLLALRSFAPLAALPASELGLVARLSYERDFAAGQTLATEGEPVISAQLIVSGRASVSRAGRAVEIAGALDTVGLLPIAAGIQHPFTTVAVEPIHALEIDRDLVDDVLEDDFDLFVRILRLGAASHASPGVLRGGDRDQRLALGPQGLRELVGPQGVAPRLLALRATPLFRSAPVDGLAAFAKRMELVHLRQGQALEAGATAAGELSVIVAGRAEVTLCDVGSGRPRACVSHPVSAAVTGIDRPLPSPTPVPESRGEGEERAAGGQRGGHLSADAGSVAVAAVAGDIVGGLEALAMDTPRLRIRAQTDAYLLRGAASDLLDVIEDHRALGRHLLADIIGLRTA